VRAMDKHRHPELGSGSKQPVNEILNQVQDDGNSSAILTCSIYIIFLLISLHLNPIFALDDIQYSLQQQNTKTQVRWDKITGKKIDDVVVLQLDNNSMLRIHSKSGNISPDMFDVQISNGSGAYIQAQLASTGGKQDLILRVGDYNAIVRISCARRLNLEFFASRYEKPAKFVFYPENVKPIRQKGKRLLEFNKFLPKSVSAQEFFLLNSDAPLEYKIKGPMILEITSRYVYFTNSTNRHPELVSGSKSNIHEILKQVQDDGKSLESLHFPYNINLKLDDVDIKPATLLAAPDYYDLYLKGSLLSKADNYQIYIQGGEHKLSLSGTGTILVKLYGSRNAAFPDNSEPASIRGAISLSQKGDSKSFGLSINNLTKNFVSKRRDDASLQAYSNATNNIFTFYRNLLPRGSSYKELSVDYVENYILSSSTDPKLNYKIKRDQIQPLLQELILGYFIKLPPNQKLDFILPNLQADSKIRIMLQKENLEKPVILYASYDNNPPQVITIDPKEQYAKAESSGLRALKLLANGTVVKPAAIATLPLPNKTHKISIWYQDPTQHLFVATQYQDSKKQDSHDSSRLVNEYYLKFSKGFDTVDPAFVAPISKKPNITGQDMEYASKMLEQKKWNIAVHAFSKIIENGSLDQWRVAHIKRVYALKMSGESYLAERSLKALILKATDPEVKMLAYNELMSFYVERGYDYGVESLSALCHPELDSGSKKLFKRILNQVQDDNSGARDDSGSTQSIYVPESIKNFYESAVLYSASRDIYENAFIAGPKGPVTMQITGPSKIQIGIRPILDSKNKDSFVTIRINDKPYLLKMDGNIGAGSFAVLGDPSLILGSQKIFESELASGVNNINVESTGTRVIVRPMIERVAGMSRHPELVSGSKFAIDEILNQVQDDGTYNRTDNKLTQILYEYERTSSKALLVKGSKLCDENKGQYNIDILCKKFESLSRWKPILTLDDDTMVIVKENEATWAPENVDLAIRQDLISQSDPNSFVISGNSVSVIDFTNQTPVAIRLKASMLALITANPSNAVLGYQIDEGEIRNIHLSNTGTVKEQEFTIDQGKHSLRIFLIDPTIGSFVQFKLHEKFEGQNWQALAINRKSKYFVVTKSKPATLTVVGPTAITVHKYDKDDRPEITNYYFEAKGSHIINLSSAGSERVFYKIYEKIPAKPKISRENAVDAIDFGALPDAGFAINLNKERDYINLKDDLPLHNQDMGTFSVLGGYNSRLSEDTQRAKIVRYFQQGLSYRYFSEINRAYFYQNILVKELGRGKPSFNFNTRFDYLPATTPINIFGKLGVNTQYFSGKQNYSINKELGIKSEIYTSRKLSHIPTALIFDRNLHYGSASNKINPKAIDPDVYSRYATTHKKWINLSYKANYQPYLDNVIWGEVFWQSNKKFTKTDYVRYSLGFNQLIDLFVVGVSCSTKHYFKIDNRKTSFNRNQIGAHLSFDKWLNKTNHRLEVTAGVSKIFDSNVSSGHKIKAFIGGANITLHLGNGRSYRDFRSEEIKFKRLKARKIPSQNEIEEL
jgi:hypothetical protein